MGLAYQEHYTIDDYKQWKGDWELIHGMPYAMSPSPLLSHQRIAGKLFRLLDEQLEDCDNCLVSIESDWEVSNDTVVRPDVLIICGEIDEKIIRTPEVIVEVVSKSNALRDEKLKFELYEKEGVLYYILAYPDTQIAKMYRNQDGRFIKVGDFGKQTTTFELKGCKIDLDFSRVWPKK